jgi:hypothetical protein
LSRIASFELPEEMNFDGFVKGPISALRLISKSLRRTPRTPRVSTFARLELGIFYVAIGKSTFSEFVNFISFLVCGGRVGPGGDPRYPAHA